MNEVKNILIDIRSGALPIEELKGFLGWLFRKLALICLAVIFISAVVLIHIR